MWRRLVRDLERFPSAVVTVVDATGYPLSVRCRPVADHAQQVLRLELPEWLRPHPGPAGLLCHSHDEQLWALRSFGLRGVIEARDGQWVLLPERHVAGMGKGGPVAFLRLALAGRKTAEVYLRRRGRPRPSVPWHEYDALQERLAAGGS